MKKLTLIVLLGTSAWASDLEARVNHLSESSKRISGMMAELGIKEVESDHGTYSENTNREELTSIIKIHSNLKKRVLGLGQVVYGKTLTKIIVGSEPVPVLINLDSNQGALSGLRVIAEGRSSGIEGRIEVTGKKVILRSGTNSDFSATVLDPSGASGIKAEVFSSKALAMAGAMGASFISGLASGFQTDQETQLGFRETAPTGRNALLQGLAQTTADQSKRLIEDSTKEKPVLVLEAGSIVGLLLNEDLFL